MLSVPQTGLCVSLHCGWHTHVGMLPMTWHDEYGSSMAQSLRRHRSARMIDSIMNYPILSYDPFLLKREYGHLKFIQECALVQSEATTVALRLEPIQVLSVIGQRTREHSWINFKSPRFLILTVRLRLSALCGCFDRREKYPKSLRTWANPNRD